MKMKVHLRVVAVSILLTLALAACMKSPGQDVVGKLAWLEGHWKSERKGGVLLEVWKRPAPNMLTGAGYRIVASDTQKTEDLTIIWEKGDLYYIPDVPENAAPVRFRLQNFDGDNWHFVNPGHDFPQKISYMRRGSDSLLARISGSVNGKQREVLFAFARVSQ